MPSLTITMLRLRPKDTSTNQNGVKSFLTRAIITFFCSFHFWLPCILESSLDIHLSDLPHSFPHTGRTLLLLDPQRTSHRKGSKFGAQISVKFACIISRKKSHPVFFWILFRHFWLFSYINSIIFRHKSAKRHCGEDSPSQSAGEANVIGYMNKSGRETEKTFYVTYLQTAKHKRFQNGIIWFQNKRQNSYLNYLQVVYNLVGTVRQIQKKKKGK